MISRARLFLVVLFITFLFISCNNAVAFLPKASLYESIIFKTAVEINNFFNFFAEIVINDIRNDFCSAYYFNVAGGRWYPDEVVSKLGQNICPDRVARKMDLLAKENNDATTTVAVIFASSTPISLAENSETETIIATNTIRIEKREVPVVVPPKVTEIKIPVLIKPKQIEKIIEPIAPNGLINLETENVGQAINKSDVILLTNNERSRNGLGVLVDNSRLQAIATRRVNDMFEKGYFDHISPTGERVSNIADSVGYAYITIGENIALGNFENSQALVSAWMASPGHRANILNENYTEIGVFNKESIYSGQKVLISAQIFGKPASLCNASNPNEIKNIESNIDLVEKTKKMAEYTLYEINGIDPSSDPNYYNAKVAQYNSFVGTINKLLKDISEYTLAYNNAVSVYNECIKIK